MTRSSQRYSLCGKQHALPHLSDNTCHYKLLQNQSYCEIPAYTLSRSFSRIHHMCPGPRAPPSPHLIVQSLRKGVALLRQCTQSAGIQRQALVVMLHEFREVEQRRHRLGRDGGRGQGGLYGQTCMRQKQAATARAVAVSGGGRTGGEQELRMWEPDQTRGKKVNGKRCPDARTE